MKSCQAIITSAREMTNNTAYAASAGISQNLCVDMLNDGQVFLQTSIINQYPQEFVETEIINVVSGQEAYDLPERTFGGSRIIAVYYSCSGYERDYIRLQPRTLIEKDTSDSGYPFFYVRSNQKIYLQPIPLATTGTLKVLYYKELDTLDVPKGVITSQSGSTLTCSGGHTITVADEYVSVNTALGVPMLYAGQIASVTSTNIVLASPITNYLVTGYTAADLVNGNVLAGKYATSHSKLPRICERYLRIYLQLRMMNKDKDSEAISENQELKEHLASILNAYSQPTEDVYGIPILDPYNL